MANSLAIATVTATLEKLLEKPLDADVSGAKVTFVRPDATGGGLPATRANLFLYQVTPSAAARNEDLPTRSGDGRQALNRPRIGLDLHYLITFYGREADFEPQRLLGSTVRTLHARPVLTRPQIRDAITAFPAPRHVEPRGRHRARQVHADWRSAWRSSRSSGRSSSRRSTSSRSPTRGRSS